MPAALSKQAKKLTEPKIQKNNKTFSLDLSTILQISGPKKPCQAHVLFFNDKMRKIQRKEC